MKILALFFSRIYLVIVFVGIPVYAVLLYFTVLTPGFWSAILTLTIAVMLMGQFSITSHHSFAYWLYGASSLVSVALALFLWMNRNAPFADLYVVAVFALALIILISHVVSRKRLRIFPIFPILSLFLFGLIIALSTGTMTPYTIEWMFAITLFLFIYVIVQSLNAAYRAKVLNKELKIASIEICTQDCRTQLLSKFGNHSSDVELLIYYFSSSLERFVEGDLVNSFIDAYKVVFDAEGRAFHNIYVLPNVTNRRTTYSNIRSILFHAKGRGAGLPEVKETKKDLFDNTISLLKIVKNEFIEASLHEDRNELSR